MTTIIASKQARRRGVVFAILIATTLLLMAFSGNPFVKDLQRGLSFALRPFQGAIAGVADGMAGVAGAVTEIDQLRSDNATLRAANERLANEKLEQRRSLIRIPEKQRTLSFQTGDGPGILLSTENVAVEPAIANGTVPSSAFV